MTRTAPAPRASTARVWLERFPLRRTMLIVVGVFIVVGTVAGAWATISEGAYSADQWRDLIFAGIALGSVYALLALGYSLVYGILLMINFAHGEVFMAGSFTSFFVASSLAGRGFIADNPILTILILMAVSITVSVSVALLLERVAYRPLRGAPRLVPLITAIGASLFLQYAFRGLYGSSARAYPEIPALDGSITVLGAEIRKTQVLVILSALALLGFLYWFVGKTRTGRGMRAVGEDREIAALMGVNVDRTIVATFALGGALAGAAGILYVTLFPQVIFTMGFGPGLKAFTAAVLGGIGSITGAALGGLILGVLEGVGPTLFLGGTDIPAVHQLTPLVSFGILVLVLIFLPGGFFGAPEEKRA